ncbi:hypothetical protein O3P69_002884 [Scylla paramamosain]|uniref:Uncharacterized protein n=1 Tax=Scylla paramamosain TaxID=85552 RepID=A0AAW0UMR0_SCYPA
MRKMGTLFYTRLTHDCVITGADATYASSVLGIHCGHDVRDGMGRAPRQGTRPAAIFICIMSSVFWDAIGRAPRQGTKPAATFICIKSTSVFW